MPNEAEIRDYLANNLSFIAMVRAWFKKGSFKVTVARQIRPSLRGGSESTGWGELSGSEELEP